MSSKIDWEEMAQTMGLLQAVGEESGSDQSAREALARLIGDDEITAAVDYYLEGGPGAELARNVLRILRPEAAADYCLAIYGSDENVERRRAAVELLRVVADESVLPAVEKMLKDPDPSIQLWGLGVLDQMMWNQLISDDVIERYIELAEQADNVLMQSMLESMREHIAEDREREKILSDWHDSRD